jgi:hypothetical protein
MKHRVTLVVCLFLALEGLASAACPPSCPIPGGGPKAPATDCLSEFGATGMRLNFPYHDPSRPARKARQVRCHDGEVGCDLDGEVNGVCVFDIDLCLRNADPALPDCTPADVTSATITNPKADPDLTALQAAVSGLLPATTNVCTSDQTLSVPLKGPNPKGVYRRAKKKVKVDARTGAARDVDVLKLFCVPHEWPMHGYNHANHRASTLETRLTPANAPALSPKWTLDSNLIGLPLGSVTSTPTVANRLVYTSGWGGWEREGQVGLRHRFRRAARGAEFGDAHRRRTRSRR